MAEFTFEEEKPKRPMMLSVLTILTFIGCGFYLLSLPLTSMFQKFMTKMVEKNPEAFEKMSPKERTDFEKSKDLLAIMETNKVIVYVVTIVGVALCIFGAVRMRQLKKEGFYIYLLGEIVPIIVMPLIIGFSVQFTGVGSYIFGLGLPALFIILYATQLKHMK